MRGLGWSSKREGEEKPLPADIISEDERAREFAEKASPTEERTSPDEGTIGQNVSAEPARFDNRPLEGARSEPVPQELGRVPSTLGAGLSPEESLAFASERTTLTDCMLPAS